MRTRGDTIQTWIDARKEKGQTSKMVFYITVPCVNINIYEDKIMQLISEILDRNNVKYNCVDTVPGAWNLNREWIETDSIESVVEYCGVYPVDWNIQDVITLEELESIGDIVVLAFEITDDGKCVPNH